LRREARRQRADQPKNAERDGSDNENDGEHGLLRWVFHRTYIQSLVQVRFGGQVPGFHRLPRPKSHAGPRLPDGIEAKAKSRARL